MRYPDKNDRYIVNGFGDDIYKFKIERAWFYEGKDKNRNGGEKISWMKIQKRAANTKSVSNRIGKL